MGHHRERQRRGQRESGKGEREGDEGGSETGLNYFGGCRAPRSPLSRKQGGGHTELVTCGLWGPSTHSLMGHHRERQRRGKRETAKCDREAIDGVRKGTGLITFGVAAPNDPLSHDDKVARVADHSRVNSRLHPGPRSVPLVNVDPKTHFIPPFLTNPLALSLSPNEITNLKSVGNKGAWHPVSQEPPNRRQSNFGGVSVAPCRPICTRKPDVPV